MDNYKTYHKNPTNVLFHIICVPIIVVTLLSFLPIFYACAFSMFYMINYLILDVFSRISKQAVLYLVVLFALHLFWRETVSTSMSVYVHIFAWILQIIGHRVFEKNSPAFIDNLFESFFFAPYLIFLETFHGFEKKPRYTIKKCVSDNSSNFNDLKSFSLPSIVYIGGLDENSERVFANEVYPNKIFISFRFRNNDCYDDTIGIVADELKSENISHIVGFSFGGAMALKLRAKLNKNIPCVLLSPGGFEGNSLFEKIIKFIAPKLHYFYKNDKWYNLSQYPLYQNTFDVQDHDYVITSTSDYFHGKRDFKRQLLIPNIDHIGVRKEFTRQQMIKSIFYKLFMM